MSVGGTPDAEQFAPMKILSLTASITATVLSLLSAPAFAESRSHRRPRSVAAVAKLSEASFSPVAPARASARVASPVDGLSGGPTATSKPGCFGQSGWRAMTNSCSAPGPMKARATRSCSNNYYPGSYAVMSFSHACWSGAFTRATYYCCIPYSGPGA
jgi:hypothetical protein